MVKEFGYQGFTQKAKVQLCEEGVSWLSLNSDNTAIHLCTYTAQFRQIRHQHTVHWVCTINQNLIKIAIWTIAIFKSQEVQYSFKEECGFQNTV